MVSVKRCVLIYSIGAQDVPVTSVNHARCVVPLQIYTEGTHFLIPFIEEPLIFDIRAKPRNITSLTGSKDLQMVNLTLRVLSKPAVSRLPTIARTLGFDWDDRVLPSISNEVMKAVIAQFNASELLTQREHVSREIRRRLVKRALDFNIVLDDVAITHLTFGREFSAAIEAKQVALQDAQRAHYLVDQVRGRAGVRVFVVAGFPMITRSYCHK